jgi:hypothetical protein
VVDRLVTVPAQYALSAELAVRTRRATSRRGELDRALADGRIIKSFAFRGATHLMTPGQAGVHLRLRSASRMWELPSWQEYYGVAPDDWPELREVVRDALTDGPRTTEEIGRAVTAHRKFRQLGFAFAEGPGTFQKPFAWQGDICFGPSRDGEATFQRLDLNPRWKGLPDLDEAGPRAVLAYFNAYAPATHAQVHYWLGGGLSAGRKRVTTWLADIEDRLVAVDIEGDQAHVLRDDLDELVDTRPTKAVHLLPGFDNWVLGPGTTDAHTVPPARRALVTKRANLVLFGGVVSGTWKARDEQLTIDWFDEAGRPPTTALDPAAARLAGFLGRPLTLEVQRA